MGFLFGLLALTAASAFTGAAFYINVAEHPARMRLDARAQLTQWKPSYDAALKMQLGLVIASSLLGLAAGGTSGDLRWLVGSVLMLANWPFTALAIMPVNGMLEATRDADAGETSRALLDRWASLHGVRSALGLVASAAFLWVAASSG